MPGDNEDRGFLGEVIDSIRRSREDNETDEDNEPDEPSNVTFGSSPITTVDEINHSITVGPAGGGSSAGNISWENPPRHDSPTVDFSRALDEVELGSGNHVMVSQSGGGYYLAEKHGELREGRKLKKMDEHTIEGWFFNEATNLMSRRAIGDAFAGERNGANGFDGVKLAVINYATNEIGTNIELGQNDAEAFNNVVESWPREAQAQLCAEELDNDRHDSYLDDCRAFAEAHGMTAVGFEQAELDIFYPPNPYRDNSLSTDEADVVMLLRANDVDVDRDLLDEIDDPSAFVEWFEQIGSVEQALQAHQFDSVLSTDQMGLLAPPDEWPDDMDPGNIRREVCSICTRDHMEVYTEEEGTEWMLRRSDEVIGGRLLDDSYISGRNFLCDECYDSWEENASDVVVVGESGTVKLKGDSNVVKVEDDAAWDSIGSLTVNEQERAENMCQISFPPGFTSIQPGDGFGDMEVQHEAFDALMAPETEFDNGTAYIVEYNVSPPGAEYGVYLHRDNAMLGQEIKRAIDENIDHSSIIQAA